MGLCCLQFRSLLGGKTFCVHLFGNGFHLLVGHAKLGLQLLELGAFFVTDYAVGQGFPAANLDALAVVGVLLGIGAGYLDYVTAGWKLTSSLILVDVRSNNLNIKRIK